MSERQRRMSPNAQERLLTILSPIAILCLWQVASWTSIIDARFVPSPLKILEASWVLIGTGELWQHLSASFFRISIGFILGVIPGIIVGMIMGLNRLARAALDPLVAAIYPIPKIAILPLLMILFGIGDGSKIAIVAIAVFFLVLINTLLGVREIDKIYLDVARNFKAPKLKFFRNASNFCGPAPESWSRLDRFSRRRICRRKRGNRILDLGIMGDASNREHVCRYHCYYRAWRIVHISS